MAMSRVPADLSPRLMLQGVRAVADAAIAPGADGLSLTLAAGECVALLTQSPADASSLIDRLAGHGSPAAGRMLVDGRDITGQAPGRRRIGVISSRDPLFGHLTVRGNVAFPLVVSRVRDPERAHRVRQALALTGLEALAGRRAVPLGAAEAIRAALARILVSDPAVLLLDDPLGALDPGPRRAMHHLLRRLVSARGLSLLLVTRDREEALMMGDRIGILEGWSLRQLGTAAELLDRPADEIVASGFGEANSLIGKVEWVEDDVARVRLSAGTSVEAMPAGDLAAGATCVVCVRPERVAIAFVRDGGDPLRGDMLDAGALPGTLTDMVHLGDHLRLRFRLHGGGELLVRRPASQPTAGLRPDRPALLAWQAAHAVAFAQES